MPRIRVVFSIGSLNGGGSERQIVDILKHLDRQLFEPFLYLIYRSGPLLSLVPEDVSVSAFEERDRRALTGIPGAMHRRRVADLQRFLCETCADVSYDRTFLMTLTAADAAQHARIPNVSTIVTDPSSGFAPVAGRFQWIKRRTLSKLYRNSTAVLAVSNGAARSAETFYRLPKGMVQTQYNGVDVATIQSAASIQPDSPWWNAGPQGSVKRLFRIVSAGRLNHHKGFHLLIDAVALLQKTLPSIEFRLALLGEGDQRLTLQRQIDDRGLTEQVSLTGFRNDAAAWYRTADVYVLASLLEGMPNVLLEAMACGTAVVSTRCPHGPDEILDGGKCGLLCEPSAESLATSIGKCLHEPEKTAERIQAAGRRIEDVFSQSAAVRRLEAVLKAASGKGKE